MGGLIGLLFGCGLVVALWDRGHSGAMAEGLNAVRSVRRSKRKASTAHWPQFIDDVASGVRAGVSVPQAMFEAGSRLDPAHKRLFSLAQDEWREGLGFEASLASLRSAIDAAAFEQFAQTIEIAHRQGGRSVATLLSQLARNVRAQEQLVHEIRGRQSVTVTSAKVAVAAPWVVLALTGARPEVRASYASGVGLVVIIGVSVVCALSYVAMRKVAQIDAMDVMR